MIVIEYINGMTLNEILENKIKFDEETTKYYFKEFLNALNYINNKGISYNDIHSSNILINKNNQIKLCDFADTLIYSYDNLETEQEVNIFIFNLIQTRYILSANIFISGLHLYSLVTGNPPVYANRRDLKIISSASHELNDLLQLMHIHEPSNRITISEIYKHNWMQNIKYTQIYDSNYSIPKSILDIKLL